LTSRQAQIVDLLKRQCPGFAEMRKLVLGFRTILRAGKPATLHRWMEQGAPQNAEFERDLIFERTKAVLASARARGRKGGAPFKMTAAKVRLAMAAMGQKETKVTDLCSELAITRQTLYRHVAPNGTLRKDGLKVVEGGKTRSGKKK
jgi:hypothetical protein